MAEQLWLYAMIGFLAGLALRPIRWIVAGTVLVLIGLGCLIALNIVHVPWETWHTLFEWGSTVVPGLRAWLEGSIARFPKDGGWTLLAGFVVGHITASLSRR